MSENPTTTDRQLNSEDSGISENTSDESRIAPAIVRQSLINLWRGKNAIGLRGVAL